MPNGNDESEQVASQNSAPAPATVTPSPAPGPVIYYDERLHGYGHHGAYYGNAENESGALGEITIGRILRLLRAKWLTLIFGMIFGICCAVFYLVRTTPVYRATALIEMKVRKPKIISSQGAVLEDYAYVPREEVFNTRLAKFNSPKMRVVAAEKFAELSSDKSLSKQDCLKAVSGRTAIKLKNNTQLVTISFENNDPEITAIAANAYALASKDVSLQENKVSSENAVAWLVQQAKIYKVSLATAEKKLADFKTKSHINILKGRQKAHEDTLAEFNATLAKFSGEIVTTSEILKILDVQALDIAGAKTLPDGIPYAEQIAAALKNLQDALHEKAVLLDSYTEKHPDVTAINLKIGNYEKRLVGELSTARSVVKNKITLLNNQVNGLNKKISSIRIEIADLESSIVTYQAQISALERERDVSDGTYRDILSRIAEARLSTDEDTAIISIIDFATKPSSPVRPQKSNSLIMGLILGFLGGFALAFLTDVIEDHVTSDTDIEQSLGLKVIGLIPCVPKAEREKIATDTLDNKFGLVAEAMAGIRTVLGSTQYKAHTNSILITSSTPAEGKTITSCNLAIVSAKSGLKTILIDFDMRRPKLAEVFGDPGVEHSLLHVLDSGDVSRFSELPKAVQCEGLSVVTSTPSSEISTADVLGGRYVVDFVKWAKENYDRVIIDSPPFGVVVDAGVLACLVDSVILMCRPNKSRRRDLRRIVSQLDDMGANILGTIVNDVRFSKNGYFSNYYHNSYHNYQYGGYYKSADTGKETKS